MFNFVYNAAGRSISKAALAYMREHYMKEPNPSRIPDDWLELKAAADAGSAKAAWRIGMKLADYNPFRAFYYLERGKECMTPEDACRLGSILTGKSDEKGVFMEIGLLCLKYAEAHGVKEAGLLISGLYEKEKTYPSSFSESRRYKRIRMGKEVSDLNDDRIEAKKTRLRYRSYYTHNGDQIHAEVFRMDPDGVN